MTTKAANTEPSFQDTVRLSRQIYIVAMTCVISDCWKELAEIPLLASLTRLLTDEAGFEFAPLVNLCHCVRREILQKIRSS